MMFKWTKNFILFMCFTLILNTVFTNVSLASGIYSESVAENTYVVKEKINPDMYDQHDLEMQAAFDNNNNITNQDSTFNNPPLLIVPPITSKPGSTEPQVVGTIVRLATIIFKNLAKGSRVTVKATSRNVVTEVSSHAVTRAVERGISGLQMDNILSEKPSGMWAVEKYYDVFNSNSRVMLDRNNKVVIVVDNALNTIITTYKLDSIHTVDNRVSEGRWKKGSFKFR